MFLFFKVVFDFYVKYTYKWYLLNSQLIFKVTKSFVLKQTKLLNVTHSKEI